MRVLITGRAPVSDKELQKNFLKEGHNVTGIDRKDASIQNKNYTHICMDIRAKEQYPELEPFDIVINNAGVQNEEDIDVNLKGDHRHYRKIRDSFRYPCSTDDRFCQRTQRLGIS